jgi:hypothetical protein
MQNRNRPVSQGAPIRRSVPVFSVEDLAGEAPLPLDRKQILRLRHPRSVPVTDRAVMCWALGSIPTARMCRGRMRMTTFSESAPEALPSAWIISAVPRTSTTRGCPGEDTSSTTIAARPVRRNSGVPQPGVHLLLRGLADASGGHSPYYALPVLGKRRQGSAQVYSPNPFRASLARGSPACSALSNQCRAS